MSNYFDHLFIITTTIVRIINDSVVKAVCHMLILGLIPAVIKIRWYGHVRKGMWPKFMLEVHSTPELVRALIN